VERFSRVRHALRAVCIAVVCLTPAGAIGADPQPYTVALAPTGQSGLDGALQASSNLIGLRDKAPVAPFALILRAREDQERLQTALGSFGYYAGQVRIAIAGRALDDPGLPDMLEGASGSVPVTIAVEPGALFRLRHVTLTGGAAPEAHDALKLAPGDPAVAADVLAAQGRILDALRSHAHALAKVSAPVATLDPSAQALDVSFDVEPGPRVDLGPIAIQGLKQVDESYVRRRLEIHPGEPYDPAKLERARQDLAEQGVFSTVTLNQAGALDAQGQLPITLEVIERARHAVSANASYSTDLGASAGVTFTHRNLFGGAERLELGAAVTQLGGSESHSPGYNVTAALTKPDIWARDQSLRFNLQAIKEDLQAYDRTAFLAGVTLSRKLSEQWTVSAGLLGQQSHITQEGVTRDYTLLGVPLTAKYDSTGLEGLLEPTHGIKASVTATPTASLLGGGGDFVILLATASTYFDFGTAGRSVLALRATAGTVQGASTFQLPPDQRLYAGGSGTVRGYKYQYVGPKFPDGRPTGGTALEAGTVEFRQRFGAFGAAAFVDAGEVEAVDAPRTALRVGAGVGARYYTAIGPIRLDFAVPLDRQHGDDTFEIYIGLGEAF